MGRVEIARKFSFDAAHYLKGYIGNCANLHGHTYECEVTVFGSFDAFGMIIDFQVLKAIIEKQIKAKFDHVCINDVVEYNPTAENMVTDIATMFMQHLPGHIKVVKVKLWETRDSCAIWRRIANE